MSAITFDTLKFAERLEKAGLTREQASAIVETQKDAMAEALDTTLATRSDLVALEKSLRSDSERVERRLVAHDGDFTTIKWMMGVLIALAITNFAKQFF